MLDSPNGSMKRDAWRSNFNAMIYALDFPEAELIVHRSRRCYRVRLSISRTPISGPQSQRHLVKAPMLQLLWRRSKGWKALDARNRNIHDLTGLQFATNMKKLILGEWEQGNEVSDLSPLAGLINLSELWLGSNPVSDISPLKGLKNLTKLRLESAHVFDLSPIAGLVNLKIFKSLW